jgi:starch-binding outer membrane protein, SusD/RagB family
MKPAYNTKDKNKHEKSFMKALLKLQGKLSALLTSNLFGMRKYNYLIGILAGMMLIFSSCEKFLEEDPKDRLTNLGYPSNIIELESAMHGMYNHTSLLFNRGNFVAMTTGTEELTAPDGSNKQGWVWADNYTLHSMPQDDRTPSMWSAAYAGIKQANWLLESVDNASTVPVDVRKLAKGQAYFMRALCYYYLVRIFGPIPYTNTSSIDEEIIALENEEFIWNRILEDLEDAESNLPAYKWDNASIPSEVFTAMPGLWRNNRALPTGGWVKSLRTYAFLHMAGWPLNKGTEFYQKAAGEAKSIIDNANLYGYTLLPDFKDLWLYDNNFSDEDIIMFGYHSLGTDSPLALNTTRPFSEPGEPYGGWNDFFVELPYFLAYPESYRKDITFLTDWYIGPVTNPLRWRNYASIQFRHPYIKKWRHTIDQPFDSIWVDNPRSHRAVAAMRYPHVLLAYAEAQTRADGAPNALAYESVNQVRRRANNNERNSRYPINVVDIFAASPYDLPQGLSAQQFIDSVLMEKSYEFVAEPESRWYDLIRLDLVYEVAQKVKEQRENFEQYDPKGLHAQIPRITTIPTDRRILHYRPYPTGDRLIHPDLFGN